MDLKFFFLLVLIGGIGTFLGNIPKTRRCDGHHKFIFALCATGGSLVLGPEGGTNHLLTSGSLVLGPEGGTNHLVPGDSLVLGPEGGTSHLVTRIGSTDFLSKLSDCRKSSDSCKRLFLLASRTPTKRRTNNAITVKKFDFVITRYFYKLLELLTMFKFYNIVINLILSS